MEAHDPRERAPGGAGVDPMLPRPFRVVRTHRDTRDIATLTLASCDGTPFHFAPGQFNMLYAFGVGEVPISISGSPDEPGVLVHTIRDVGAVTHALAGVRRGDIIGVRGPYGTAWPVEQARGDDVILVAGGIGLAPLRPAFYHILARRRDYGRITLVYGARTPEDILYRHELEHWRGLFGLDVEVTVDAATDGWFGPVGVVTRLLGRARFDAGDTTAMVCGPEVMIRFTAHELEQRGVGGERVYVSLERNMKCGIGFCGHCQLVPHILCKTGPVYRHADVAWLLGIREA